MHDEGAGQHECSTAIAAPATRHLRAAGLQEFIELVRAGRTGDAITYARRHLAPFAGQHMAELQRAVATLAFKVDTLCAPYRQLFEESQVGGQALGQGRAADAGGDPPVPLLTRVPAPAAQPTAPAFTSAPAA